MQKWPAIALSIGVVVILSILGLYLYDSLSAPETLGRPSRVQPIFDSAVPTGIIVIKDCMPFPKVAAIPLGSEIAFRNEDGLYHFIYFNQKVYLTIGPERATSTVFKDWTTPGLRSYSCDGKPNVGTIYLK